MHSIKKQSDTKSNIITLKDARKAARVVYRTRVSNVTRKKQDNTWVVSHHDPKPKRENFQKKTDAIKYAKQIGSVRYIKISDKQGKRIITKRVK